jgi:hypothetical protein
VYATKSKTIPFTEPISWNRSSPILDLRANDRVRIEISHSRIQKSNAVLSQIALRLLVVPLELHAFDR